MNDHPADAPRSGMSCFWIGVLVLLVLGSSAQTRSEARRAAQQARNARREARQLRSEVQGLRNRLRTLEERLEASAPRAPEPR